jgi:YfiH family protein
MKTEFILRQHSSLQYYTISSFDTAGRVVHGFTVRHGGISSIPYESLNLAFHVGDDPDKVRVNREAAATALGFSPEKLVTADQVHGDRIVTVTAEHAGMGAMDYTSAIPATDALITNVPGIPIATFYADCVPVFILDPVRKVIGLAHAGWKGTVLKIAQKTLIRMSETYGTRPGDCIIGIAPSIGPCCYEVDSVVYKEFDKEYKDTTPFLTPTSASKWQLDLWAANLTQLLEIGVRQENVVISRICTCCNKENFFSYRGENGQTGRMGAFMMLAEGQTGRK